MSMDSETVNTIERLLKRLASLERRVATLEPQRWRAQISGQLRTITAAQDYLAELADPEADFWDRVDKGVEQ